ncbi:MAG: hypothetical protein WAW88_13555 [Nocardioides sp.]
MRIKLKSPWQWFLERDERGDVPGWVMITVMTALLVGALYAIAGPKLQSMLQAALDSVGR